MKNTYLYLRASTEDQDASRAKATMQTFADDNGLTIVATYTENESGAKLDRPELMRLLTDAVAGSVLLVEQIDRLSRLSESDWLKLRAIIEQKHLIVVSLDLPTALVLLKGASNDFMDSILRAINTMMLDMLAAIARKDYNDRRRRQAEGIEQAKLEGVYKGRPVDVELRAKIQKLLGQGMSQREVAKMLDCARGTVAKVANELKSTSNV